MKKLSINDTVAQCIKIRPVLEPFLNIFGSLLELRQVTADQLGPALLQSGIKLPDLQSANPLLRKTVPADLGEFVKKAAHKLLPSLTTQQAIQPFKKGLETLFLENEADCDREALIGAALADCPDELIALAKKYEIQPEALHFSCEFIVSSVLRALVATRAPTDHPDWRKGYCPICGLPPVIAWLDRKPLSDANEFLTDGGGRKRLHCGMCGTDWYFIRGVCPACGTQGQDAMQILGEEERRYERIDWCKKCSAYLPQIDLRELADTPDLDVMALGLMHLDMVAAEKDLIPLKASFWNMF